MKCISLQGFLKIRLITVYMILIIISVIFFNDRWNIVIGLTCGVIFGILKYIEMSRFIANIVLRKLKELYLEVFLKFLLLQIISALLLIVAIKISLRIFLGAVAGMLLIPMIITINSLTEALGISHNNFQ